MKRIRIGSSTAEGQWHNLGENEGSYAFCSCGHILHDNVAENYGKEVTEIGDVIYVYLDMTSTQCKISFSINDHDFGNAFVFQHPNEALYPAVSSKNVKFEKNFSSHVSSATH